MFPVSGFASCRLKIKTMDKAKSVRTNGSRAGKVIIILALIVSTCFEEHQVSLLKEELVEFSFVEIERNVKETLFS